MVKIQNEPDITIMKVFRAESNEGLSEILWSRGKVVSITLV